MISKYNLNLPVTPSVNLIGQDGNAFFIMGRCLKEFKSEMRRNGYDNETTSEYCETLMNAFQSGSYDDLLCYVAENYEVR